MPATNLIPFSYEEKDYQPSYLYYEDYTYGEAQNSYEWMMSADDVANYFTQKLQFLSMALLTELREAGYDQTREIEAMKETFVTDDDMSLWTDTVMRYIHNSETRVNELSHKTQELNYAYKEVLFILLMLPILFYLIYSTFMITLRKSTKVTKS